MAALLDTRPRLFKVIRLEPENLQGLRASMSRIGCGLGSCTGANSLWQQYLVCHYADDMGRSFVSSKDANKFLLRAGVTIWAVRFTAQARAKTDSVRLNALPVAASARRKLFTSRLVKTASFRSHAPMKKIIDGTNYTCGGDKT